MKLDSRESFPAVRRSAAAAWMLIFFAVMGAGGTPASGQNLARQDAAFTEFFRQTNGWAAGDGAISVPLSDGRVIWIFGDSYVDQYDPATGTLPCLFSARNAALVQNTNDAMRPQTLRDSAPGEKTFFKPPETKSIGGWPCFWPGAGFQSGNTVYIYQMEMEKTAAGGMFGFTNIGQFWAKLSFPELKITGYTPLPAMNGISFWCGYINDAASGWTYAFGNKGRGIGSDVYVARFATKNPEGAWAFWDGKNWGPSVTHAAIIATGASVSVGVCKVNGKYLLTTSAFSLACDEGRDIYISVADRPTGPFSPRKKIFTVDDTVKGHYPFFYAVFAHPEFINAANELLITYSINGYEPCVPTCVDGRMLPDYYRPRAIRIPLRDLTP